MTFSLLITWGGGGKIGTHLTWVSSNLYMYYRLEPEFSHREGISSLCGTVQKDAHLHIFLLWGVPLLNPGEGKVMTVIHFV